MLTMGRIELIKKTMISINTELENVLCKLIYVLHAIIKTLVKIDIEHKVIAM